LDEISRFGQLAEAAFLRMLLWRWRNARRLKDNSRQR